MNSRTFSAETEVDYLVTNAVTDKATAQGIVTTYSQRNWAEVFDRESQEWLG